MLLLLGVNALAGKSENMANSTLLCVPGRVLERFSDKNVKFLVLKSQINISLRYMYFDLFFKGLKNLSGVLSLCQGW